MRCVNQTPIRIENTLITHGNFLTFFPCHYPTPHARGNHCYEIFHYRLGWLIKISDKSRHLVCTLLCNTSFTQHYVFEILHVVACISSSFLMSSISLYKYMSLFIHSPIS